MDINQLRLAVNSLTPDQLQDFTDEAHVRMGVAILLGKPLQEHLLVAAMQLIHDRLLSLGIKPRFKEPKKPRVVYPIIARERMQAGRHGKVTVTKVSPEEMEKLWNKCK